LVAAAIDDSPDGASFARMKAAILALSVIAALSGCSIHTKETLATVRAAGVSPRTVAKLDANAPISPEDVIELRRHRVSDSVPIYHLDRIGVDYAVTKDDLKAMRAAKVSSEVSNAVADASRRFTSYRYAPRRSWYWGYDYWDPYPAYVYPSLSFGYVWGGGHRHYHRRHCD
jgi:hypothetical protein